MFAMAVVVMSAVILGVMMVQTNNDSLTAHEQSHEQACLYFGGNPSTTYKEFYAMKYYGEVSCANLTYGDSQYQLASAIQEVKDYQAHTDMRSLMALLFFSSGVTWCLMALQILGGIR